jgi:hypothetical protein
MPASIPSRFWVGKRDLHWIPNLPKGMGEEADHPERANAPIRQFLVLRSFPAFCFDQPFNRVPPDRP